MSVSRLDKFYRSVILTQLFTKGWGTPENLNRIFKFRKIISDRSRCSELVSKDYPVTIINNRSWNGYRILDGKFLSPLAVHLPGVVPPEVEEAYFQVIIPKDWNLKEHRPMCIHLAGTGDHHFWRRRNVMAKPLLKSDIGAILLENPFYGLRKPKGQIRSSLHHVSDIFVMGGCLILECLVLLHWCERMGFGPLGVSGMSMGGHMASLAATNWPKPLVLVPCLSWSTASSVFTEGVLSDAINWDCLQQQFFSDSRFATLSKSCVIVDDPFQCPLSRIIPERGLAKSISRVESNFQTLTPHDVIKLIKDSALQYSSSSCRCEKSSFDLINLFKQAQMIFSKVWEYSEMKEHDKEAVWFMRGVMDECTHLKNFSIPFDTSLAIVICAMCDAYVPRQGCSSLADLWPGCTIRYLETGHVGAYLWHRKTFREAIVEAFERAKERCSPPSPSLL